MPEGATCEMPMAWQVKVLDRRAQRICGCGVSVVEQSIVELHDPADTDLLEEIIDTGATYPVVFVDGRIVCSGSLDIEAVLRELLSLCA